MPFLWCWKSVVATFCRMRDNGSRFSEISGKLEKKCNYFTQPTPPTCKEVPTPQTGALCSPLQPEAALDFKELMFSSSSLFSLFLSPWLAAALALIWRAPHSVRFTWHHWQQHDKPISDSVANYYYEIPVHLIAEWLSEGITLSKVTKGSVFTAVMLTYWKRISRAL